MVENRVVSQLLFALIDCGGGGSGGGDSCYGRVVHVCMAKTKDAQIFFPHSLIFTSRSQLHVYKV